MATYDIPQVQFNAGTRRELGPVDIPADSRHAQITLVSDEWIAKAGQGFFEYGLEQSTDGVNWELVVGTTSPFGAMGHGIYMPSFGATAGGPGLTGQLRLYGTATARIRMGCTIEITPVC